MGYYYDATITLTYTDAEQVTAALDLSRLAASGTGFDLGVYTDVVAEQASSGKPVIPWLLTERLYAEILNRSTDPATGITTVHAEISGSKYRSHLDLIWSYLASVGVGLDVEATGEDGERWFYHAERTAPTSYTSETYTLLPRSKMLSLTDAQKMLDRIRTAAQKAPTLTREQLLDLLDPETVR